MEYKRTNDFQGCRRIGDIYTECGSDYSLPDYNGDVRRILFTDARVYPSGSFDNGDSVDFSGIVTYNMVYSDSENRINSVSFSSDYDFTVKCNEQTYESASADISVASYNMRLIGPRKISAKATVAAGVTITESLDTAPEGTAFETADMPEVECVCVDSFVKRSSESTEREYAEELIRLDGAILDELSVIYSDAECVIDSVSAEEGGAALRGNLRIYALVKNGDEPPFTAEKSIRIDESIPISALMPEQKALARVSVGSVRASINADENGCAVAVSVILDMACESIGNQRIELVTDAYRKDCEVANSFENFVASELVTVISEREEMSSCIPRDNIEVEAPAEIICLRAIPKINSASVSDSVARLAGEIRYNGIIISDDGDGKTSCHPFKTTVEFEKNVNINCQNSEKLKVLPSVVCCQGSITFDENNICLSSAAHIKLIVTEDINLKVLSRSDIIADSEIDNDASKITVYYPECGEGLFEIAKKFHTTVEKLTEDNSAAVRAMSGDAVAKAAHKLLIF